MKSWGFAYYVKYALHVSGGGGGGDLLPGEKVGG